MFLFQEWAVTLLKDFPDYVRFLDDEAGHDIKLVFTRRRVKQGLSGNYYEVGYTGLTKNAVALAPRKKNPYVII